MRNGHSLVLLTAMLAACSSPGGPYPSLQPRAAEAIDPRVPVTKPMNERPVTPALASQLAALVDQARNGDAAFEGPASEAERLASSAGAPQSDSWIVAQEALTAAIAARKTTSTALADIDAIGGTALQTNAGIAPNDLAAIKSAAAQVSALDQRQAERIDAIQKKLGL
ncbi:MAG: hypothetical protein ACTHJK_11155 [Sphingomicrobium sp.]